MIQTHSMNIDAITSTLNQQFANGQLAHGYIFNTRDAHLTKKTVEQLVQSFLCNAEHSSNRTAGCGQCKSCQLFWAGNHPDFKTLGDEGASLGVDEVRALGDWLSSKSQLQHGQFAIINNAHSMTENAANALLKTLEEPSQHSYLMLINGSNIQLLPTITSRCQVFNIEPKSKQELKALYPQLPDYMIGFANGDETQLQAWSGDDQLQGFEAIYEEFIGWLKSRATKSGLLQAIKKDPEYMRFLTYLLERRVRQMLSKGLFQQGSEALKIITNFNFAQNQIKGQNKELATTALLEKLDVLVK